MDCATAPSASGIHREDCGNRGDGGNQSRWLRHRCAGGASTPSGQCVTPDDIVSRVDNAVAIAIFIAVVVSIAIAVAIAVPIIGAVTATIVLIIIVSHIQLHILIVIVT